MNFGIQKKSPAIHVSDTGSLVYFRPGLLNLVSKKKVEDNCICRKSATLWIDSLRPAGLCLTAPPCRRACARACAQLFSLIHLLAAERKLQKLGTEPAFAWLCHQVQRSAQCAPRSSPVRDGCGGCAWFCTRMPYAVILGKWRDKVGIAYIPGRNTPKELESVLNFYVTPTQLCPTNSNLEGGVGGKAVLEPPRQAWAFHKGPTFLSQRAPAALIGAAQPHGDSQVPGLHTRLASQLAPWGAVGPWASLFAHSKVEMVRMPSFKITERLKELKSMKTSWVHEASQPQIILTNYSPPPILNNNKHLLMLKSWQKLRLSCQTTYIDLYVHQAFDVISRR